MEARKYYFVILFLISSLHLFAQRKEVEVIYIGDSITAGAGVGDAAKSPPAIASDYLQKLGIDTVKFSNQGHSGFTTVDFLPQGEAFKQVEQAANTYAGQPGLLIFSIMLGTNDSAMKGPNGAPVAPGSYFTNLKVIIDRLLNDYPGCRIIVQYPLWYSPNTYNGSQYLQEGLNRLQSYYPLIKQLVKSYAKTNNGQVFAGDTTPFSYFKTNYLTSFQAENGHQGVFYLHPNEAGAKALGTFWAKSIYKQVIKY